MLKQAISGRFKQCLNSPEGTLSVIILLDQFSRNIYRDTPRAFFQDEMALNISLKGIDRGYDKKLIYVKRSFFYMPLMHSEDINMQSKSVICLSELEKEFGKEDGIADLVKKNKKYVVMHYGIIDRFGRFPHRNRILSRESTKEEIEFLKRPGNSF